MNVYDSRVWVRILGAGRCSRFGGLYGNYCKRVRDLLLGLFVGGLKGDVRGRGRLNGLQLGVVRLFRFETFIMGYWVILYIIWIYYKNYKPNYKKIVRIKTKIL